MLQCRMMRSTRGHTQITGEEYNAIKAGRYMRYILSGIHPEFSFPVIPDMFTYPERCPPALSMHVLMHLDP